MKVTKQIIMKTAKEILRELKTEHEHLEQIIYLVSSKIRPDLHISFTEKVELKKLLEEVWAKIYNKPGSPFGFEAMQIATWLNSFAGAYSSDD